MFPPMQYDINNPEDRRYMEAERAGRDAEAVIEQILKDLTGQTHYLIRVSDQSHFFRRIHLKLL